MFQLFANEIECYGSNLWMYFSNMAMKMTGRTRNVILKNDKRRKPMNIRSKNKLLCMGFVAIMTWAVTASAQDKPADNMQIVIEKVRADKKLLIADNMQLTETEAKAFWPVYNQYQDELFLLRVRTAKLIGDYRDAYDKMTNDTAKKLLDEYINIETLALKLRKVYLPKFREVLPDAKVLRYYQIENKIYAALVYEIAVNIPLIKADK
ncbi:MAG: hypothetical protein NG784_12820 [Candidatus Jettenia sp.]|nr:hypothetical protein [Candidatus Jettenia sp.]